MVWSSDGSVNGDESFGNLVWDVYCANFIYGCLDELAMNFDSTANTADNDLCIYDFTYGCIDTLACNYADTADVDDGSCFYAEKDSIVTVYVLMDQTSHYLYLTHMVMAGTVVLLK